MTLLLLSGHDVSYAKKVSVTLSSYSRALCAMYSLSFVPDTKRQCQGMDSAVPQEAFSLSLETVRTNLFDGKFDPADSVLTESRVLSATRCGLRKIMSSGLAVGERSSDNCAQRTRVQNHRIVWFELHVPIARFTRAIYSLFASPSPLATVFRRLP